MTFPVRWFFWVPFVAFLIFALAVGSASGSALGDNDMARFLVLAMTALLGGLGATACAIVASGKSI